jgi:hypothetical protein
MPARTSESGMIFGGGPGGTDARSKRGVPPCAAVVTAFAWAATVAEGAGAAVAALAEGTGAATRLVV